MRAAIVFGLVLIATGVSAQTFTRVMPNGLTIERTPHEGITVFREGPRRSFSISVGHGTSPTANASAYAVSRQIGNRPAVASASASTSVAVRTNGNGQSIDIARARATANGNVSTSTSAHTSY